MSEERRVQSAPAAPAVPDDEIPLDADVGGTPPPPAPPPMPSDRPPRLKPAESAESLSARRVRARMTLRIPDDEVGRPTPLAQPAAEPIAPMEAIKGHLIISVGAAPSDDPVIEAAPTPPAMQAAPPSIQREESWTPPPPPFEPPIADIEPAPITPRVVTFEAEVTGEYPTPIPGEISFSDEALAAPQAVPPAEPSSEHLDFKEMALTPLPPAPQAGPLASRLAAREKLVVPPLSPLPMRPTEPTSEHLDIDEAGLTPIPPRLPVRAKPVVVPPLSPLPPDLPPVRPRMSALMPDASVDEELPFDEELPAPTESEPELMPRPPPGKKSEPGEPAEIEVEDLLAVESAPRKGPPIPPMRPKAKSVPPPPGSNPPFVAAQARSAVPALVSPIPPQPSASPYTAPAGLTPQAAPLAAPLVAGPPAALIGAVAQTPSAPAPARPRLIVPQALTPQAGQAFGIAPPAMTAEAAQRKRTRPWWEELFNDDFIKASAKLTDEQIATEVNFIEESLGVARDGGMLLDLACGMGLHAIELARRGYHVVGFDLSLAMLARAADEAQERNVTLNFVQGDMRDMTFDETFDGVFSWNTSFGFFEEEKNAQVISRVHKALKPGGVFLLDVVNRDYIVRQSPSLAWFEGEACVCMDEMQLDFITSRIRVKRTMMHDDGRTKEIDFSIRVYSLHELGRILHEHGFKVLEVSGRLASPGIFFGNESPRTLILAEKRST